MRSYVVRCWLPSNSGVALKMPIEPFVLIVADHDKRIFSVEGPMVDDNPWSKPVVDAQEGGKRHVNCLVPGGQRGTMSRSRRVNISGTYGYTRADPGSIVHRKLW